MKAMHCLVRAGVAAALLLTAAPAVLAAEKPLTLEQRVQRIEDESAIERLQNIYGYYVDKRLFNEVVDLFSEKGTVEISHRGVYVGKEGVRRLFVSSWSRGGQGLSRGQLFNHMMLQPVIHLAADGKSAKGRFRTFAQVGQYEQGVMWVDGLYENEFVKEGGIWKYSKMRFWPTFYVPEGEGFSGKVRANIEFDSAFPADLPPTDDAGVYPDVYYPPFHYPHPVTGKDVDVKALNEKALKETTTSKKWVGGEPLYKK